MASVSSEGVESLRAPLRGARKVIAEHMMQSLHGSAQLSFHTTSDVTELLSARVRWKATGRAISIEDCIIAAIADVAADNRQANGTVTEDGLLLHEDVNVAVAISINALLLTPVIRQADKLSLDEIAARRRDLVEKAKASRLQTSEMTGGTVTISNLGLTTVRHFTPILNKGQLVILGVGRIEPRLVMNEEGAIEQRQEIGLSLTVDHRFIDGEPAAQILGAIGERLGAVHERR